MTWELDEKGFDHQGWECGSYYLREEGRRNPEYWIQFDGKEITVESFEAAEEWLKEKLKE